MPAVIDPTSSPEPDDPLGKTAKSALQYFQPRKQKSEANTPNKVEDDDEETSKDAAVTALNTFQPRKQRNNTDIGGSKSNLSSKENKLLVRNGGKAGQQADGQHKQRARDNTRHHAATAHNAGRTEAIQQPGAVPRQVPVNGIQHGSLASLLQQEVQLHAPEGTTRLPDEETKHSHFRRQSRDVPSPSTRTDRIGNPGDIQRATGNGENNLANRSNGQPHSAKIQDKSTFSPATTAKPALQRPVKASFKGADLGEQNDLAHSTPIARQRQGSGTLSGTVEGVRPFKRQRISAPEETLSHLKESAAPRRSQSKMEVRGDSMPVSTDKQMPIRSTPRVSQSSIRTSRTVDQFPQKPAAQVVVASPSKDRASSIRSPRSRTVSLTHEPIKEVDSSGLEKVRQLSGSNVPDLQEVQSLGRPRKEGLHSEPSATFQSGGSREQTALARETEPLRRSNLQNKRSDLASPHTNSILEPPATETRIDGSSNHGVPYTPAEDELLAKLKEAEKLSWDEIIPYFNGRSYGSLQVRYSSKLKQRRLADNRRQHNASVTESRPPSGQDNVCRSPLPNQQPATRRQRKKRNNETSVTAGFMSWADVKKGRLVEESQSTDRVENETGEKLAPHSQFEQERAFPKSTSRILRHRELGSNGGRSWMSLTRSVPDELKVRVFDEIGPEKYFKGTSGDVVCVAWAPNNNLFAAGSIAITDERSMQYNRPLNLLLGEYGDGRLHELPEHHITRPNVDDIGNVNRLHSMRETQDTRLFMTVASVQFSPSGDVLYTAGCDRKVMAYNVEKGADHASCMYEIEHPAPLDLISVSNSGRLATACHQSADGSIGVYQGKTCALSLSPSRLDTLTDRAIYPSSLRWGTSAVHSDLLLAGFSIDSVDEERDIAGETCLWDVRAETRIEVSGVTRNVFDVAWNPRPSSSSTLFAVASTKGSGKVKRNTRSVVQCFAPNQNRAKSVLEWESPAFDINDVVYCQHDDSLIAAGATDGKIYVWDQRFAGKNHAPLHTLEHGETLNVLDHDRAREIADTGVRFLSWGATSSRLYTGSSDGVVKVWNPYRSSENAHIKDVAKFDSAVMSGAFSPDDRDLLIGEDQGRLNLLSVGCKDKAVRAMQRLDLHSAIAPAHAADERLASELIKSRQIELRPMGGLPVRQAVQGPNYDGPYLAPSIKDTNNAEDEYQRVLDKQSEAHSRAAIPSSQSSETSKDLRQADRRVEEAQELLLRLQSRLDDAVTLGPRAEANQLSFRRGKKDRLKLEASLSYPTEHCKLDCTYLPPSADNDGEVPDSYRSEARIPGALRALRAPDMLDIPAEALVDVGMTHKCMSCSGAAYMPKVGKLPLCERCHRIRKGLTASCDICAAPIRTMNDNTGNKESNLCERCNFACFRCAKPIFVPRNASSVTCDSCGLTWRAGVLGYELVTKSATANEDRGLKFDSKSRNNDSTADQETLSCTEIEYYASRWQTVK